MMMSFCLYNNLFRTYEEDIMEEYLCSCTDDTPDLSLKNMFITFKPLFDNDDCYQYTCLKCRRKFLKKNIKLPSSQLNFMQLDNCLSDVIFNEFCIFVEYLKIQRLGENTSDSTFDKKTIRMFFNFIKMTATFYENSGYLFEVIPFYYLDIREFLMQLILHDTNIRMNCPNETNLFYPINMNATVNLHSPPHDFTTLFLAQAFNIPRFDFTTFIRNSYAIRHTLSQRKYGPAAYNIMGDSAISKENLNYLLNHDFEKHNRSSTLDLMFNLKIFQYIINTYIEQNIICNTKMALDVCIHFEKFLKIDIIIDKNTKPYTLDNYVNAKQRSLLKGIHEFEQITNVSVLEYIK